MIKKFAPFLYCLTPLCAGATQVAGTTGVVNQITGDLNVVAPDSYEFMAGAGINVDGAINAAEGLYVGLTPTSPNAGAIYAWTAVDSNYAVTATDSITIGGPLQVNDGYNLTIGGASSASPVNITTGAVEAIGGLTIQNADALSFAQFVASGSDTANISGNSLNITTGDFQALDSKVVTLNLGTGAFSVAEGAIENKSSGDMTITAGAITAKTITNEAEDNAPTGNLAITASALTLTGGDATNNASFVLSGNFRGTITGATQLAHGFDLSGMGATNTFNLTTGTLSLGDRIGQFYTNNLNSFVLHVTSGDIDAGTNAIRNGTTNDNAGMTLTAQDIAAAGIENSATMNIVATGAITMTGDVENSGALDIVSNTFDLENIVNSGTATFNGSGAFNAGAITNATGATSLGITGSTVTATGLITNNVGTMNIESNGALSALGLAANAGTMNISGTALNIGTSGIDVVTGASLNTNGNITSGGQISVANNLSAGAGSAAAGDMAVSGGVVNIVINNDEKLSVGNNVSIIGANALDVQADTIEIGGNISQTGTTNSIFSANTVSVVGDINANNFTISNLNTADGVNITVGSISGGLDIMGLQYMTVNGNYTFDDNSHVLAIANSSSTHDYWTDVDFSGNTPVVNALTGGQTALITVNNGSLISTTSGVDVSDMQTDLEDGQFGIVLHQPVTESSALWLATADDIQGTFSKLSVGFCSADGTHCVNYLDAFADNNDAGNELPVYLVTQGNDLYVVFDNRFGDPMGLYKLQPVVAATPGHTLGEWQSAGALDDVIEAVLADVYGLDYETAILPVVQDLFKGTPLENVDSELYARMNEYARHGNGNIIRNFSRLFQLREANQIADSLVLNTRTNFMDMSDRFIDESIWNRNRRLNKLWVDGGYGRFTNDLEDIKGDGDRFNLALGYDWQSSETLILGWMLHGSYTKANVVDDIDLSYGRVSAIAGRMESDMKNLSFGGGVYFLDTLSNKARLYGDLMFDVNMIDVERNQTWVDTIKGDATSFGVAAELGLIHDWLNQYIIGNLYARAGYNFGFDMTEKVGDADYMNLEFDGYPILTPGYSLTAQKRVYPSAWFEFRPYATVGVEYDLLHSPDTMKYKFAMANKWTDYNIDIDPLWANAGAGVEFLWVNGLHIGLGYRYQYNADVQMHKVHASMKYRF